MANDKRRMEEVFLIRNEELFLFEQLNFEPLNFEPLNLKSSEGTTDNRLAVKCVARNPCKKCLQKNQSSESTTELRDSFLS